ncbi:MAG: Calx-beta domain-containing protein [Verrucomicrobiae bacterium]|nr:Calx-beta domain-containing protein [Verrucomicrobiae bacterium]
MKRLIASALVIGAAALVGIFLFTHRTTAPPPATAVNHPTAATSISVSSRTASAATPVGGNSASSATVKTAPAPTEKEKLYAAFNNFSRWAMQFTNSQANLVEGQRLAWKRREAMLELIQTDPQQAIAQAVPFELRQSLPVQVTKLLEEQVDGRGDLEVLVGTDFAASTATTYRNVQLGDRRFQAFVYGRRDGQISQTGIPLHGVALDGKLAVAAEPLRALSVAEAVALDKNATKPDAICSVSAKPANWRGQPVYAESGGGVLCFCGTDHFDLVNKQWAASEGGRIAAVGGSGVFGTPTATDDSWTHGNKSVLYIRLNFPDDLTEPITDTDAYSVMDSVNDFYTQNSYDLTSLTATVTPLITLPQTKAYYSADPGLLLNDARAYAKKAGYVTANYDRDIVAFTSVPGYSFGGLAFVGGKGVWLQSMGAGVTAHELGHNYGLWHANFWNTLTNYSMIGPGTNLEYGNIYDTMGLAGAGIYQFNAIHKSILDWLKADAIQNITSNGVYRVYPFDVPASKRVTGRVYAAALKKDSLRYYWLEFRQKFTANPWVQNGLLLNWTPWDESNGGSQLIDTTPGSPDAGDSGSRSDAAVVVGRTFNDNAAGIHITPLLRGNSGTDPFIDYQVNLGAFTNNQPPVLSMEVDQTNVAPGALVHFHATASDPDGDTLAYSWTFDDLTFSTNNLPWVAKAFTGSGDHVVRCVVSDLKGGEASANAVVSTGASAGDRLTGRVTDANGAPLEGVLVGNGLIPASQFIGGWTDSDGRYIIVNVDTTNSFNLGAFQYGYTFASANWSNPLLPTNDIGGLDFVATPLPGVNVFADTNSVAESDGSAHSFTITRTGSTNNDLTVNYTVSGTATAGSDYTLDPDLTLTNALIIPAGSNSVTITLNVLKNNKVTGPVTVTVTLRDDDANRDNPNYALAPLAEATVIITDDDAPATPTVTLTTTTPEISEDGMDNGELVFMRNGSTAADLYVNYAVSGTATPGTDYVTLPGVVLIPAGQSSTTVPLTVIDDKNVEPNETVTATITPNAAYTTGSPATATITILDDDFMTVTVAATANAAEPATAGQFTVKRDGDLTAALIVNYNLSGTASNGVDYAALSGTVTIPAGAAAANIFVSPLNDALPDGDETVTISITNTVNYDVGTPGSATLFIRDGQKPTVDISATIPFVSEQGDTTGQFTLTRSSSTGDLPVYLNISGTATPGADYLPLDNPVIIPDGSTSVTVDVIPFHDLILEPTETVIVTLPTNANYNASSSASATVEITDDGTSQIPGIGFCFASSAVLESESPGIAVTLSQTSSVPVQVDYRVIGGTAPASRYVLPQGTLIIPSNTWVAFIPLQIIDDSVVEPPQTIKVVLFNPTNATLDAIKVHTYTILDDDACSVSVAATAANAAEAGRVAGNFRISRSGSMNADQLVNFQVTGSASAPTDYAPLGNSATIPAGAAFVDLPVTPVDDNTMEFPQTVVLTLTSATNASIVSPNIATVTIADNDTNNLPVVTVTSTNHPTAYEGGGNGQFLFTRTGPTTNALTVVFTVSGTAANGVDYAAITNGITIPAGQSSATVTIVPVDDSLVEGDETVIVSLTEGNTYRVQYPSAATVTIQDNDQRVWIDASDFEASKFGFNPGEFTFSRFGTTNTPVTIVYSIGGTASNGVDYVKITNSIVIPAGQLTVTLPILPLHNGIVKGPATATLTLLTNAAYFLGTRTNATVTIDDDMPMLTISAVVTNVLEGSGSNGVFRVTRTGDPKYDFTAYLSVGGTATFGVDYPPFPTNIYFTCGMTAIDLFVTPTNEVVVEGDETVTATLLPGAAYTILSPSNAVLTIADAGTNQTPQVIITSPLTPVVLMNLNTQGEAGLVLNAVIIDQVPTNDILTWTVVSGPGGAAFGDPTTNNTTVMFTNLGSYRLRLTADNGQLQGHADLVVYVGADVVTATNLLHWTLDDGSGTTAADSSGNGRDGTLAVTGPPDWTASGVVAGALNLHGAGDCVRQSAGSNTLDGLSAFTVALWIKSPPVPADQGFLTGDDSNTNSSLSFATRISASCGIGTDVIEVTVPTTKGVVQRTSASGAVTPDAWQHVALTWTNGEAPKLYINGQLDQPAAGFIGVAGQLTNCPQFIAGKGAWDSPDSLNGGIDDVRVFDQVLSAEDILQLADYPVTNHAPVVDAGTNFSVQMGIPVTISGTVSDDGLPNPPGSVTNWWTYLGTNDITITNPASLTNSFVFDTPGDYVFRLYAFDGQDTSFSDVTITVLEPIYINIYASDGDASELGPDPGEFTVTRTGDTNTALTIYLAYSGTASNGVDYIELTNVVTFPALSNTLTIPLIPILDDHVEGDEAVIATVQTNIAYVVTGSPATVTIHDSPYGLWSIQHFTLEELTFPNISGAAADFDHDGVKNFAEYAFSRDPRVADGNPPYDWDFETSTNDNQQHLTLTYSRRLPPRDVEYGVYVSTDLMNWNTGTNYVEEFMNTNNLDGVSETVKVRALMPFPDQTNLFMNIRVWLQQVPVPPP